jgi:predicted DNA binding CopG/RHH family protein
MKKAAYLDKDERKLAKSLENEEWVSDLTKKEKKQYQEYARYSLNKQKRINIRMTERDLKKIRAKAIEEGIPYQSLISMLIHKFNEGKCRIDKQQRLVIDTREVNDDGDRGKG